MQDKNHLIESTTILNKVKSATSFWGWGPSVTFYCFNFYLCLLEYCIVGLQSKHTHKPDKLFLVTIFGTVLFINAMHWLVNKSADIKAPSCLI